MEKEALNIKAALVTGIFASFLLLGFLRLFGIVDYMGINDYPVWKSIVMTVFLIAGTIGTTVSIAHWDDF